MQEFANISINSVSLECWTCYDR